MNSYLIGLFTKIISLIMISIMSLFNSVSYKMDTKEVVNNDASKSLNVINKVINYTTEVTYKANRPSNVREVTRKGVNGLAYVSENGKDQQIIRQMVPEHVIQGTGSQGEYVGKLSAYGPDCPGCSKVGNVACLTREGKRHSLVNDGIYYNDSEYGKIRILSAAREKFPCGTVIKIDNGRVQPYLAIVLDSGGSMVNAWKKGTIWIDLAYQTQASARGNNTSGSNVKFSVQRWGW